MGASLLDIFLHPDRYIGQVLSVHRTGAYILLFAVIFIETGLVFAPFLPGDSLLLAAGSIAAIGKTFNIPHLLLLLYTAAIAGDWLNYSIGKLLKSRVLRGEKIFLVKPEHIEKTQCFFDKHGGKTVTLARFMPIFRTFAPFVAGMGDMHYGRFLRNNVAGGVLWVSLMFYLGYFFGNIAYVREHFGLVTIAVVLVSAAPLIVCFIRPIIKKRRRRLKRKRRPLIRIL
jgi:membrane-associated protein